MQKIPITLTVGQYILTCKDAEYIVTLVPLDTGLTDFYIHKKGFGFVSLIFGVDLTQFEFEEEADLDRFVQSHLCEWAHSYEEDLIKLESA